MPEHHLSFTSKVNDDSNFSNIPCILTFLLFLIKIDNAIPSNKYDHYMVIYVSECPNIQTLWNLYERVVFCICQLRTGYLWIKCGGKVLFSDVSFYLLSVYFTFLFQRQEKIVRNRLRVHHGVFISPLYSTIR